jgi:hypothetical protein
MATGVQPSEYERLTQVEIREFINALKKRQP